MFQNVDVTWEVKFVSNNYSNPNTNPKTHALTLTDPRDAFDSFLLCAGIL